MAPAAVADLIAQLDALHLTAGEGWPERSAKVAARIALADELCEALDGQPPDGAVRVEAVRALLAVHGGGPRFAERAQALARDSGDGELYARATDILCTRHGQPQRYGTLRHRRDGEETVPDVDPTVTDGERAALGLPPLAELRAAVAARNRRQAEELAATAGLPIGANVRRVWREEDEDDLRARLDAGGPVWRDGEELVFAWRSDADAVALTGGVQMPLWRVGDTDLWVLRARVRDLDRAVVGYGFLGTTGGQTRFMGGDGCWRGEASPPAPAVADPLTGELRVHRRAGPGDHEREVWVYLPPGHHPAREHAVVYLADGGMTHSLARVLEPAITGGLVPPAVLVGVANAGLERPDEYMAGRNPDRFEAHRRFFVDEIGAWAEDEWGASRSRDRRSVFGVSNGAGFAVSVGARHPDRFGHVLAFSLGGVPPDAVDWSGSPVPAHYLAAGTLEDGFRRETANYAALVRDAGGACEHVELVAGHDFRMWEGQFPLAVAWAFSPS